MLTSYRYSSPRLMRNVGGDSSGLDQLPLPLFPTFFGQRKSGGHRHDCYFAMCFRLCSDLRFWRSLRHCELAIVYLRQVCVLLLAVRVQTENTLHGRRLLATNMCESTGWMCCIVRTQPLRNSFGTLLATSSFARLFNKGRERRLITPKGHVASKSHGMLPKLAYCRLLRVF